MMRYVNRMNDNETSTLRWLYLFSLALVIVVVSAGCVTGLIDGRGDRRTASGRSGARRTEEIVLAGGERLSDVQRRIVDAAHHIEGRRNLVFEGKRSAGIAVVSFWRSTTWQVLISRMSFRATRVTE